MILSIHVRQGQYPTEETSLHCQTAFHARLASIVKNLHSQRTVDPASPGTSAVEVLLLAYPKSPQIGPRRTARAQWEATALVGRLHRPHARPDAIVLAKNLPSQPDCARQVISAERGRQCQTLTSAGPEIIVLKEAIFPYRAPLVHTRLQQPTSTSLT